MRFVILLSTLFLFLACKEKSSERDIASLRPNYQNYNWTGKYQFVDGEDIHELILKRGRVDADYQVAYTTTENAFGGSIWKLNDFSDSIQIVFINNFTENAEHVPFERGDHAFTLTRNKEGVISTNWYKVQPTEEGSFSLLSD